MGAVTTLSESLSWAACWDPIVKPPEGEAANFARAPRTHIPKIRTSVAVAATPAGASATPGKLRAGVARSEKVGDGACAAKTNKTNRFCEGSQERTVIATTTVQWSS